MFDNWLTWGVIGYSAYKIIELLITRGVLK